MAKYHGEFTELQAVVSELGYSGQWKDNGNEKEFRSANGAILRWWASTKTIQFQGREPAKAELQNAMSTALLSGGQASAVSISPSHDEPSPSVDTKKVFVVYGHDETACEQLELVLSHLNLEPFVLTNTGGGGLTIIEALENEIFSQATGDRFGIVLLTPDDIGYEQGNPDAVEPRARQNVVLEMGMLITAFGRPRVAILRKGDVVVPSDASGILYIPFNTHVRETVPTLCKRLRDAGFELSTDAVLEALS